MSLEPEALYARLRGLGEKWADADAAYRLLDDVTKTVLAECELEAKSDETNTTQAAIERAGRVAPKYRAHLAALGDARKAANRAKVNLDAYHAYIELARSKAANDRAEANLR
jgi:hypothetical protein